MTPNQAQALGLDIRPDGAKALVVLYKGAAFAWVERSQRDRHLWRGVTVSGALFHARTVSELIDTLAANLPPS
jgi:hypothetical protein